VITKVCVRHQISESLPYPLFLMWGLLQYVCWANSIAFGYAIFRYSIYSRCAVWEKGAWPVRGAWPRAGTGSCSSDEGRCWCRREKSLHTPAILEEIFIVALSFFYYFIEKLVIFNQIDEWHRHKRFFLNTAHSCAVSFLVFDIANTLQTSHTTTF